jgi:hypothetical protein
LLDLAGQIADLALQPLDAHRHAGDVAALRHLLGHVGGRAAEQLRLRRRGGERQGERERAEAERRHEFGPLTTVTARRFCDQQEMSSHTATGRSLPKLVVRKRPDATPLAER